MWELKSSTENNSTKLFSVEIMERRGNWSEVNRVIGHRISKGDTLRASECRRERGRGRGRGEVRWVGVGTPP